MTLKKDDYKVVPLELAKSTKLTPQIKPKQRKRLLSHTCSRLRLVTSRKTWPQQPKQFFNSMPTFSPKKHISCGAWLSRSRRRLCHTLTSMELSTGSLQAKWPHRFAHASFSTCSHALSWCGRKLEILYLKLPQEAQRGANTTIRAECVAAEQLCGRSPVLVL